MRRPRGLIELALGSVACLLCACDASEERKSPRDGDRSDKTSTHARPTRLTWGPVVRITGGRASRPAAVMAPDGTATVMVAGSRGGISREAPPGMPWKPAEAMPHTGQTHNILAGVDMHGTVTAVWDHNDSRSYRYSFWSARHPAGGSWSRPVQVGGGPQGDVGWQGWDLAVSPSGAAVFAWGTEDGLIRARYRATNGAWAPVESLPGAAWPPIPIVTIDHDGRATAAYPRDNPGLLTLVQGSAKGWEEPVKLETRLGLRPYAIDAARSAEVVVAWQQPDLRYLTGRFRGGTMTGQRPLTQTGETSADIQVAAATDGSARFVWRPGDPENIVDPPPSDAAATPQEVHSIDQSGSGKLSDPEVIGTTGLCGTTGVFPMILERNERGDTLAAWDNDPYGLDVAYRSSGTEDWSPQDGAVPDASGPNCYSSPAAALAENGSAVLTWENYQSNPDQTESTELLARRVTISR